MPELGTVVEKIRSKNAGPFWLTIDIFCGADADFQSVVQRLKTDAVAKLFSVDVATIQRFDIIELQVIKLSLPRPVIQGTRADRDMHGAQWACLLEEYLLPDSAE